MSAPTPGASRAARAFLLLTVLIDATGIGIIFPVMPDLLEQVTGTGIAGAALWGGVLGSGYAVMQFLFGPVVGNLSDAYGRRPVMLTALAVMALDCAIMAVSPSIWLLLAGRMIAGMTAASHATATAAMADISTPEDRGRHFGMIGAAFGIGFTLGPLLGSLAAGLGVRAPFWVAAGLAAGNAVFGWFVLRETLPVALRRPLDWRRANPLGAFAAVNRLPGMAPLLWVFALYSLAAYVYPAVWSFYGKARFGWDPWMIGLSLALFGVAIAAVQGALVGPAIARLGAARAAILGFSIDIAAYLIYAVLTSGTLALIMSPIAALGGIAGPALQQLMSASARDDQQGELQGVLASLGSVATGLAPLPMTALFAAFTREGAPVHAPGAPFFASAVLMAAGVAVLVLNRGPRRGS